jgi:pimeloyl-ACP methyl ester carboxylesterase
VFLSSSEKFYVKIALMKTLIFFHAFPFSSKMWEKQVNEFSKDFKVHAIDLPGFGSTPLPEHPFTFEYYVEYVQAWLKERKIEKSIWCGLSMGGYLALRLYQLDPELCEGLILCDTKATLDGNEAKLKRWGAIKSVLHDRAKFDEFQWRNLISKSSHSNRDLQQEFMKWMSENSDAGIMNGVVAIATRSETANMLEHVKVPTLILVGEDDQLTPENDARFLQHSIPKSELKVIPRAGHLANLEAPKIFNEALSAFLHPFSSRGAGRS